MPVTLLVELLARRARRAGARWALVGVAVALAGVPLVVSPAVARTTAAAALRRGVEALPAGQRSLIASDEGPDTPAEGERVDAAARRALAALGGGTVRRQVLLHELSDRTGQPFRLAATDDMHGRTRLASGRWPGACTPARCEVVELAGTPAPAAARLRLEALGLTVVGRVTRADPLLLSGTFDPGTAAPLLLADGASRFTAPAPLAGFGTAQGWVASWDPDRVLQLGAEAWIARAARAGDDLARVAPGAVLTVPDQVLRDEDARARRSASRLGLLAAGGAAVLLGAAVLGGLALRRDHEGFADALRLRGAGPAVTGGLLAGEALAAALLGALGAVAAGGGAALVLARRAGLPAATTAGAAVGAAAPWLAGLTALAAGLVVIAVGLPAPPPAGRRAVGNALLAGAAGCLAGAGLLAGRGGVSGQADADDTLVTALPVLVLTAAGLLTARLWPLAARLARLLLPRGAVAARLGLSAVLGRPARPAATAGVVCAALATGVFAAAYATTLDRGAAEEAAHAVPLDALLRPGPSLAPVLDTVDPAALAAALPPGSTAYPVLRTAGAVRVGPQRSAAVHLVGLDPAVLPSIARWTASAGPGADPHLLARRLASTAPQAAVPLPPGDVLTIATGGPVRVVVTAHVRAADGREREVPLAAGPAGGLAGRLPRLAGATRLDLVSVGVRLATDLADRRLHALGEGGVDQARTAGTLDLGALAVDGVEVARPWATWSAPGGGSPVTAAPDGGTLRVDYRLGTAEVVLVPVPAAGPVEVLTDPETAATATGGRLTLLLDGLPLTAHVAGVAAGFPTVTGRFAVLDARVLAALVHRTEPGAGAPAELWVRSRDGAALAAAATRAPLAGLDVRLRPAVEASLRADPVARSVIGLLVAGAALALAVALAAVVLQVVSARHDDAAVHDAWEADGVAPGVLRASLWWGAVVTTVPAALAGAGAGLALAVSAVRLVAVTATATTPVPPLRPRWGDAPVLGVAAAGVVVMLAAAGAVAARSRREPLPGRGTR